MTVREAIFQSIEDRFSGLGCPEVERMPSGDPAAFPALHIFDGGHDVTGGDPFATEFTLSVTIEGYVQGDAGAGPHAELHNLYAAAVAALMADPPLDGLVETIDEGAFRVSVAPLADVRSLAFTLDFAVTYFSSRIDPAQPA